MSQERHPALACGKRPQSETVADVPRADDARWPRTSTHKWVVVEEWKWLPINATEFAEKVKRSRKFDRSVEQRTIGCHFSGKPIGKR